MGSAPLPLISLRRWLIPGAVLVALLACIAVVFLIPQAADTAGFAGIVVGMAVAGVLYFRRSSGLEKREKTVWRLIGMGTFLVSIGVLVVGILTESGLDLPAFGPLDSFFLAGYLCLIAALVVMARLEGGGREWLPTLLDALVGGVSLSVLVWTTFYRDLMASFDGAPWAETLVASLYPILDVAAIVGLIIMIIRRSHFHFDVRLIFVAFGLTAQVFADFIYLNNGVGRSFVETAPVWPLILTAAVMFVAGGAVADITPKKREFPEVDVPLWALVWPYLFASSLLALHVGTYRSLDAGSDAILLLDAVIAVGILVFVRQLLAIRRNQVRVEKQRSELVASVSHELRTPLTAIVGYLDILDEEIDSFPEDARREMIAEANSQAQHMARLVSDLVMLARGIHRNLPLEITEVSLTSIVTSALRNSDAEGTKIDVECEAEAHIRVDPVRVQQALSNLLSNAVRYGGDQAILVTKVVGDDLVVEMHDNGPGVPTRYEAMIWQRFERGANRLNANNPGLGIGLAIVEAIAQSHGGSASYRRSDRLGGAEFSFVLPGCVARMSELAPKVDVLT